MSRSKLLICVLILMLLVVFSWMMVPKPELLVSILIRMLSFGVAVYISIKFREWKIMFLAAMFFLMALRQMLTFSIWTGLIERNPITNAVSEIPGFIVTILSLLSISYVGFILSGKIRIIEMQQNNINTLNSLLPMCAKCRRIRDDDGYWKELETYIESHTDSQFSHGLCEACAEELYGDKAWFRKRKNRKKD